MPAVLTDRLTKKQERTITRFAQRVHEAVRNNWPGIADQWEGMVHNGRGVTEDEVALQQSEYVLDDMLVRVTITVVKGQR